MQTDNNKLFRSQVTEHATRRLYGDVLVAPRPSQLILTSLLVAWVSTLLYIFISFEWTEQERVEGRIERQPQTNQLIGQLYIPVDARRYLSPSQSFEATVDAVAARSAMHLKVMRMSTDLLTDCPVCPAGNGRSLYIRAEAQIENPAIVLGETALQLAPGVRFHFILPTRRQTLWDWIASRESPARAKP